MKPHQTFPLIALAVIIGCADNDAERLEQARQDRNQTLAQANEKLSDEQRDVDKAVAEANEKIAREQADMNQTVREANEKIDKIEGKVNEIQSDMEQERLKAVQRLTERMREHNQKLENERQRVANDNDPGKSERFARNAAAVQPLFADAQARITAIERAPVTSWKPAHEEAERAVDVLDQGMRQALDYGDPDKPAPVITPLADTPPVVAAPE